jgi:hypothetical protein
LDRMDSGFVVQSQNCNEIRLVGCLGHFFLALQ